MEAKLLERIKEQLVRHEGLIMLGAGFNSIF